MLQPGTIFDSRYELVRKIGRGGFAEVWLVKDTLTGLEEALKIYAPGSGMDEDGLKIFAKELSVVHDLRHTNLLTPKSLGQYENQPYLILPYCPNGSLNKLVGLCPEDEAWRILEQVAAGLAYLHEQGIVHQDIKPDNILIDAKQYYVITDFGISLRAQSTLRNSMRAQANSGTMAYMAPERFSTEPNPIPANDIWSLGAMMFELIEGNVPFVAQMGGLAQKGGADIPTMHANVSDNLKRVIRSMLALNAADRPTAAQLVEVAKSRSTLQLPPEPDINQKPQEESPSHDDGEGSSSAAAVKHPDYTPKWRTGGESGHGGGSGQGGSGGGHTPTPNSGSKLWLWISLAAVLILLGAGVIFAILYVNNNRHMFKRNVTKEIKLTEGQKYDLKGELRDGITNVKEWKVMNNDVHIDGNGLLTIDSTYVTEPSTCIKVVAIYDGKVYNDSVFIHLEYNKAEKKEDVLPGDTIPNEPLEPEPDNKAIAQQYANQAQQSLTRAKTEAQKATKPDTKQKAETELAKVKKAADEAKKAAENEDVDLARQKAREANIAANKVAEIVKADAVTTTPQSAEYVLMVRPVGSTPNFAKDGDGIKPYAANGESAHVIAGDECVVYLVKKTGEQKTPVNAKVDFRKGNIEITDMGSQNDIHWYKCSIVNGQETGVFSYVYDGKKIKIQLSK